MHHQNRRADINGILYLLVDFHAARCRKVFSVKIPSIFSGFFDSFQCYRQSTHLQLHTLIRCLSVFSVNVPFSIQHIILQHLEIHLIILRIPSRLMIPENGSVMNSHTVHNLCCNLVGSNVFLFPFQSHVIPDHVFGLIQIAVLQIFYFQSHRWQMVPVHHKYHRLRIIRKLCRQLFDKYVHLMNLIYIIFPGVIIFFPVFRACHCNLRIVKHRLCRIITVALYRNRIDIIRFVCRIERFYDLFCQNMVFYPSCRRHIRDIRHIFLRGKGIKTKT